VITLSDELQSKVSETQNDKVKGAASGFAGGGCIAIIFGVVGLILCCTGIGAIIGIPLIFGAIFAPFLGAGMGLSTIKGPCPFCGYQLTAQPTDPGINCPACKKRVVIRDKKFIGVE
jgi:DNA-directed RNA polymerase subunit RPC12/RpoP